MGRPSEVASHHVLSPVRPHASAGEVPIEQRAGVAQVRDAGERCGVVAPDDVSTLGEARSRLDASATEDAVPVGVEAVGPTSHGPRVVHAACPTCVIEQRASDRTRCAAPAALRHCRGDGLLFALGKSLKRGTEHLPLDAGELRHGSERPTAIVASRAARPVVVRQGDGTAAHRDVFREQLESLPRHLAMLPRLVGLDKSRLRPRPSASVRQNARQGRTVAPSARSQSPIEVSGAPCAGLAFFGRIFAPSSRRVCQLARTL